MNHLIFQVQQKFIAICIIIIPFADFKARQGIEIESKKFQFLPFQFGDSPARKLIKNFPVVPDGIIHRFSKLCSFQPFFLIVMVVPAVVGTVFFVGTTQQLA